MVEVCEELAFHGIEYILSVSVGDGQVLLVDVEKVSSSRRALLAPRPARPRAFTARARSRASDALRRRRTASAGMASSARPTSRR